MINEGTAFGSGSNSSYDYNDRSELTDADRREGTVLAPPGTLQSPGEFEYVYDNIGNREEYTRDASTTTYTVNAVNQYDLPGTPNYDDDGNLISDGEFAYGWDAENRLISITPPSPYSQDDVKLTFDYDYLGRRVVKKVWTYDAQFSRACARTCLHHRRRVYATNRNAIALCEAMVFRRTIVHVAA